jgi:CheY-like chemotaxis protein
VNDEHAELVHDLKTPIAVIAGYAELLAIRADEETRLAAAEQILTAAKRLSSVVDQRFTASENGDSAPRPTPLRSNGRHESSAHMRILVVDDDGAVRSLLRTALSSDDYEIAEASDGDTALSLVDAQQPHVVLLDWHMPNMCGEEVLTLLKQRDESLPVVVLTSATQVRDRACELGADAFFTKPFSPRELLDAIEALASSRA